MDKISNWLSQTWNQFKPTAQKLVGGLSKAGNFLTSNHETIGNVLNTFGNVLGSLAPGDANNKLKRLAQGLTTTGQSIKDNDNIGGMFTHTLGGLINNYRTRINNQPRITNQTRPQNQQFGINPVQQPIQQPSIPVQRTKVAAPSVTVPTQQQPTAKGAFIGKSRNII